MGKKNPNVEFPLLYINKRSKDLFQVKKIDANNFVLKQNKVTFKLTRPMLQKSYEFYGVIDRFGVIIAYEKVGSRWVKRGTTAAHDGKKWKSIVESEKAIIEKLNKINHRNPELAYYDPRKAANGMREARDAVNKMDMLSEEGDPNWEEV